MNEQQEPTIDDVWINRLAQRLGILTTQNERLMIENEALTARLEQLQSESNDKQDVPLPPEFAAMNGESR